MEQERFVDLETARAGRGLRLVVAAAFPSPWSEAAKGLFRVKGVPVQLVRFKRELAAELAAWTGVRNVPIVLFDDEPPRAGWAEILALAERLGGKVSLVPDDQEMRIRLHGLLHELAGENGLGWSARLLMIDGSLVSGGTRGFPLPVAQFLAPRYGYAPERVPAARTRILEIATLFDRQLAASRAAGHRHLLGEALSALDIYLATFLTPAVGITEADCPGMRPDLRPAFAHLWEEIGGSLPPALIEHRAYIFDRHLGRPIVI
jgi:glutathione S-transferase